MAFSEDDSLVAACKELLGAEAGFVDSLSISRELLLGGWLRSSCLK